MRRRSLLRFNQFQFKTLTNFFSDLGKGVILGAIVGQGFILKFGGLAKFLASAIWILGGCAFLVFALYLGKEVKNDS